MIGTLANKTAHHSIIGVVFAALAISVAWAASAFAAPEPLNPRTLDDDASPFESRQLALDATVGAGTPLGVGGLSLEGSPVPALVMSAGVGMGTEGVRGAFAVGPRFVFLEHGAVDLNLGYAVGNHRAGDNLGNLGGLARTAPTAGASDIIASAHMFTMSMHARYRTKGGVQAGFMVGVSKIMNENDFAAGNQNVWLPYVGASVGYAFSL